MIPCDEIKMIPILRLLMVGGHLLLNTSIRSLSLSTSSVANLRWCTLVLTLETYHNPKHDDHIDIANYAHHVNICVHSIVVIILILCCGFLR